MSRYRVVAVGRNEVAARPISERMRSQLVYFASGPDRPGVPKLGESEYFIKREDTAELLRDGVMSLVSPLDTANTTEVELTDEQIELLEWLEQNDVEHVRVIA